MQPGEETHPFEFPLSWRLPTAPEMDETGFVWKWNVAEHCPLHIHLFISIYIDIDINMNINIDIDINIQYIYIYYIYIIYIHLLIQYLISICIYKYIHIRIFTYVHMYMFIYSVCLRFLRKGFWIILNQQSKIWGIAFSDKPTWPGCLFNRTWSFGPQKKLA